MMFIQSGVPSKRDNPTIQSSCQQSFLAFVSGDHEASDLSILGCDANHRAAALAESNVCAAVELMANGKKDDPSGILVAEA